LVQNFSKTIEITLVKPSNYYLCQDLLHVYTLIRMLLLCSLENNWRGVVNMQVYCYLTMTQFNVEIPKVINKFFLKGKKSKISHLINKRTSHISKLRWNLHCSCRFLFSLLHDPKFSLGILITLFVVNFAYWSSLTQPTYLLWSIIFQIDNIWISPSYWSFGKGCSYSGCRYMIATTNKTI